MKSEWSEILFTYDEVEANIVKGILESENIQVAIDSLKITPYPVSIGRIGEVRVLVKNDDMERAREILKAIELNNTVESDDN